MADHINHEERDGGSVRELNSSHNSSHEKDGRITTSGRKALPSGKFALPPGPDEKRRGIGGRFPIDTEARARNALARVSQFGTPSEKQTVRAAVRRAFPDIEVS